MSDPKVYLVTGTSRGIGLELVRQLAERKDVLVFAGARNPEKSEELKKIQAASGERVVLVTLDSDDEKSIAAAAKQVSEKTKKLDVLINNAGIAYGPEKLTSSTEPSLEVKKQNLLAVYQTNVVGLIGVTQAFFPLIKAAKKELKEGEKLDTKTTDVPKVINISTFLASISSLSPSQTPLSSYVASKAALNILTSSAAIENPGIAFIPLSPGWVDTDMGSHGGKFSPPLKVADSAKGILSVTDKLTLEGSGKFVSYDGSYLPW